MLVFDTAWSLFSKANRADTTAYMDRLVEFGFDGFVSWVWFHGPSSANVLSGHGTPMQLDDTHYATDEHLWDIRRTLDDADARDLKVCVGSAWQNLYLPGGGADDGNPISDSVRGVLDTPPRARSFANDIRIELGVSPAVHAWVVGGDPGTNSTPANLPIVQAQIDAFNAYSDRPVVFHSGTANFGGHYYAQGLTGLAAVALQTGHQQNATATRMQLSEAVPRYSADGVEVWQGEPRYHSINFDWVGEQWRNPGTAEMVADAQAAKTAGVTTYWYGNNDRWQSQNLVSSFGDAEREVLALLQDTTPAVPPVEPPVVVEPEPEPEPEVETDSTMAFFARGTTGTEILEVSNDRVTRRIELGTALATYSLAFNEADGVPLIAFVNDGRDDTGTDRNVFISEVTVDSDFAGLHSIDLDNGLVTSYGKWDNADQRCNVVRYGTGGWLHCNGWIDVQDLWDELSAPTPPPVVPEPEPPVECPCPECVACEPCPECPPFDAGDFAEYVTSMTLAQALAELLDAWDNQ